MKLSTFWNSTQLIETVTPVAAGSGSSRVSTARTRSAGMLLKFKNSAGDWKNALFQPPEMAAWVCVRSQNGTGWHKVLSGVTNTFCVGEVTPENQSQQGVFLFFFFPLTLRAQYRKRTVREAGRAGCVCERAVRPVCLQASSQGVRTKLCVTCTSVSFFACLCVDVCVGFQMCRCSCVL